MRITNNMINERSLFNIQQSLYRIARMHDKLSSAKKYNIQATMQLLQLVHRIYQVG